ncbi:membrane protein [Klebsiella phage K64-1]|uniref:membrane protein n=1 Tax=Klebsiella phage K64-1 TaxID=1439894 RepID=UPI00248A929C|nr:membrane protein [Klebsiella phage K64-1]
MESHYGSPFFLIKVIKVYNVLIGFKIVIIFFIWFITYQIIEEISTKFSSNNFLVDVCLLSIAVLGFLIIPVIFSYFI